LTDWALNLLTISIHGAIVVMPPAWGVLISDSTECITMDSVRPSIDYPRTLAAIAENLTGYVDTTVPVPPLHPYTDVPDRAMPFVVRGSDGEACGAFPSLSTAALLALTGSPGSTVTFHQYVLYTPDPEHHARAQTLTLAALSGSDMAWLFSEVVPPVSREYEAACYALATE
jgi:hypothetical protein